MENLPEGVRLTYGLVLHACEDDVEHLCECGLGSRLVDEVLAGQVDVVAGAHTQQHRALVDLTRVGRHHRQQRLQRHRHVKVTGI